LPYTLGNRAGAPLCLDSGRNNFFKPAHKFCIINERRSRFTLINFRRKQPDPKHLPDTQPG
jgi:hypothetical protein